MTFSRGNWVLIMSSKVKLQPISPCKDCTERHPNCHSSCERYNNWKNTRKQLKEQYKVEHYADQVHGDTIRKIKGRKRKNIFLGSKKGSK